MIAASTWPAGQVIKTAANDARSVVINRASYWEKNTLQFLSARTILTGKGIQRAAAATLLTMQLVHIWPAYGGEHNTLT